MENLGQYHTISKINYVLYCYCIVIIISHTQILKSVRGYDAVSQLHQVHLLTICLVLPI